MKTIKTFNRFGKEIGSITFNEAKVVGFVKYQQLPGLMRLSIEGMADAWVSIEEYEGVNNEQQEQAEPTEESAPAEEGSTDEAL